MGAKAFQIEDLPQYTYDDYVQWEGRWELIKGIPYAMTPAPAIAHQIISSKINWQLRNLLQNCNQCEVLSPVDWPIEILSPDTANKDKILKYRLYEESGVKYFCIVDPETKSVVVFLLHRQEGKYRADDDFKEGKMPFELGPCRVEFDFGRIF